MITYILPLIVFALIAGCAFVLFQELRRMARDPVRQRLTHTAADRWFVEGPAGNRPLVESLAGQLPQTSGKTGVLDHELRRAGYYQPEALNVFLAIRNSLVIIVVVCTATLAVTIGPEYQRLVIRILLVGTIATGLVWALPRLILRTLGNRRVERISRSVPFALDIITMCLSGGLSLRDALKHVSRELRAAQPDLAMELTIVQQQADMTSLDMSLRQFTKRIDAPEIAALSALIAQSQQLGTDTVHLLRDYSESIRSRWRQAADERASKTGVKMLFPLTFCLLPVVLIVLWGPAVMELWIFLTTFSDRYPTSNDVLPIVPFR